MLLFVYLEMNPVYVQPQPMNMKLGVLFTVLQKIKERYDQFLIFVFVCSWPRTLYIMLCSGFIVIF